jgi:hypothetical protein
MEEGAVTPGTRGAGSVLLGVNGLLLGWDSAGDAKNAGPAKAARTNAAGILFFIPVIPEYSRPDILPSSGWRAIATLCGARQIPS